VLRSFSYRRFPVSIPLSIIFLIVIIFRLEKFGAIFFNSLTLLIVLLPIFIYYLIRLSCHTCFPVAIPLSIIFLIVIIFRLEKFVDISLS